MYKVVNVFVLLIRECGSTLYVGLARAVPPTNTNFRLTFFTNPTSGGSLDICVVLDGSSFWADWHHCMQKNYFNGVIIVAKVAKSSTAIRPVTS